MSHWEEENEEDDEDSEMKSNDDHIIFLIDCRKAMYAKNSKGEIIIINVLKMLLSVLKSKIIASDKTCIGAICFGCVSISTCGVTTPIVFLYLGLTYYF